MTTNNIIYLVVGLLITGFGHWLIASFCHYKGRCLKFKHRALSPFIGLLVTSAIILILTYATCTAVYYGLKRPLMAVMLTLIAFAFIVTGPKGSRGHLRPFWKWAIEMLNDARSGYLHGTDPKPIYLIKLGPLYIRDPNSFPMRSAWCYSPWHPFMFKRKDSEKNANGRVVG